GDGDFDEDVVKSLRLDINIHFLNLKAHAPRHALPGLHNVNARVANPAEAPEAFHHRGGLLFHNHEVGQGEHQRPPQRCVRLPYGRAARLFRKNSAFQLAIRPAPAPIHSQQPLRSTNVPAKPPRFFFNAHCHLELSHLRGAIPSGTPFVEWLGQVVRLKRQSIPELVQAGIALALNEMRATGTRALIDIDSMRASSEILRAFPIAAIACTEVIEFHAERAADAVRAAREYQDEVGPMGTGKHFGLSPHAPYTTTEPLLRAARAETGGRNEWLCIHAAETPEEVEMMLHGRGPLYDFLRAARVLPEGWRAPGMRPVEYLAHCGALGPRTLLVHLNEVTDDEI